MLQFEEYITTLFKIDLNISIVDKTIKIPTRENKKSIKGNQSIHKGGNKHQKEENNKNKAKDTTLTINEKKKNMVGPPPKKKGGNPLNNNHTRGEQKEKREK